MLRSRLSCGRVFSSLGDAQVGNGWVRTTHIHLAGGHQTAAQQPPLLSPRQQALPAPRPGQHSLKPALPFQPGGWAGCWWLVVVSIGISLMAGDSECPPMAICASPLETCLSRPLVHALIGFVSSVAWGGVCACAFWSEAPTHTGLLPLCGSSVPFLYHAQL